MYRGEDGWNLTAPEMAVTVYNAWKSAGNVGIEFEELAHDLQDRWLRAVRQAILWLPTLDGKPVSDAARRFTEEWAEGDELLRMQFASYGLGVEAAVRHLSAILDAADDLHDESDIRALEESWAAWAQRRPSHSLISP